MVSTPVSRIRKSFACGTRYSRILFMWNRELWALESCIFLTTGIGNPSSTDKESRILELGIHSVESRIQKYLDYPTWDDLNFGFKITLSHITHRRIQRAITRVPTIILFLREPGHWRGDGFN